MRKSVLFAIVSIVVAGGGFQASALTYLFTNVGAGTVALTVGTGVTALSASNDSITAPSSTDTAIAFADNSGAGFSSTGPATFTGMIQFSDLASKSTGGTCPADGAGACKVDLSSSLSNTTVTGLTSENISAVNGDTTQWNALIDSTNGWGSVAGTVANLSGGGTLCVGSATGCTATAATPATLIINGQLQTAYVFNITSSGSHINGAVTIKGDGSGNAMVILNYGGAQKLQSNQVFTLAGGLTDDQVLLNVTSTGGMQTSGGFDFNGAIAIQGSTAQLDNADINGRLYIDISGSASIPSGFDLNAPTDVPGTSTPEPGTMSLMGAALIWLALLAGKRKRPLALAKP